MFSFFGRAAKKIAIGAATGATGAYAASFAVTHSKIGVSIGYFLGMKDLFMEFTYIPSGPYDYDSEIDRLYARIYADEAETKFYFSSCCLVAGAFFGACTGILLALRNLEPEVLLQPHILPPQRALPQPFAIPTPNADRLRAIGFDDGNLNSIFKCPITLSVLEDPVSIENNEVTTKFTFERSAIEQAVRFGGHCPLTRERIVTPLRLRRQGSTLSGVNEEIESLEREHAKKLQEIQLSQQHRFLTSAPRSEESKGARQRIDSSPLRLA